jgi:hypothetical protein
MSEINETQPTSAALVGSLAAFPLLDVLHLMAGLGSSGEFQVLGNDLDRRFWVDRGEFVDPSGATPRTSLFELACLEGGWFSFTAVAAVPEGDHRVALAPLIDDAASHLAEWRALVRRLPFEAVVRMSQSTPSDEVQIRADQWRVLSIVGPGRSVLEVLTASPLPSLEALRTLGQLLEGQLISVELPPGHPGEENPAPPPTVAADPPLPKPEAMPKETGDEPVHAPRAQPTGVGRSAPATQPHTGIMPPPITGDPWSTPSQMAGGHRHQGG